MTKPYQRIHGPEPLLDREPTKREVEAQLGPQLELLEDLADYGILQLKRCFKASSRDVESVVVILIAFRQVLLSLDAVSVLLRNGASNAANLPLRSLFEASWTMEWMLEKEPQEAWKRFYVSFLRKNRLWSQRIVSGTPERTAMLGVIRKEHPDFEGDVRNFEPKAKTAVQEITAVLATEELADVDAEFEKIAAKRGFEPAWYQVPDPGGLSKIGSIRQLAIGLSRKSEYEYLYGSLSAASHGTDFLSHVKFDTSGAVIEPIRSGDGFVTTYSLTGSVALRSFRLLMSRYRPEETQRLDEKYVQDWRELLQRLPEVVMEVETDSIDTFG